MAVGRGERDDGPARERTVHAPVRVEADGAGLEISHEVPDPHLHALFLPQAFLLGGHELLEQAHRAQKLGVRIIPRKAVARALHGVMCRHDCF